MGIHESSTDSVFVPLLDRELKKVSTFYASQEKELLEEVEELEELVREQEEAGLDGAQRYLDDDDDDDEEDEEDEDTVSPPVSREGTVPPKRRRRKSTSASHGVRFPTGSYLCKFNPCPLIPWFTRESSCTGRISGSTSL
jgi:phosphate transporter